MYWSRSEGCVLHFFGRVRVKIEQWFGSDGKKLLCQKHWADGVKEFISVCKSFGGQSVMASYSYTKSLDKSGIS